MPVVEKPYCLITGASSGIGRAIAIELSKQYNLVLHGRKREKLEKTKSLCEVGDHRIWIYDFEQIDNLQAEFETYILSEKIKISHFVHCAGMILFQSIRSIDLSICRQMIDADAISAILLTGSLMKKRVAGATMKSIVFISSIAAYQSTRGKSLYAASKGMLNSFVRASSVELAPQGVRINSVCPAAVETEMATDVFADPVFKAAMDKRHPLGTGKPKDIVGAVEFLLSDKASWITGTQIMIDGGASCDLTFK